jgi:hypothetical protein
MTKLTWKVFAYSAASSTRSIIVICSNTLKTIRVDGRVRPLFDLYGGSGIDHDESPSGMDKLQSVILVILGLYADRVEKPFYDYFFWELLNREKAPATIHSRSLRSSSLSSLVE